MPPTGASGAAGADAPDGPDPDEPAGLTVASVARRLGVAPATLRTWDRRYGLGPSRRTTGSHRRYGPEDMSRLGVMHRLIRDGVPAGEAARAALAAAAAAPEASAGGPTGRRGGGRVVALPHASAAAKGLARAAMALDGPSVTRAVAEAVERHGVVATWDDLLVPVLAGIGSRWARTGEGVEVEHLVAESVSAVLGMRAARLVSPVNRRPVLLASAEGEMHALPLHAVAAGLAERGVGARVLGARVPLDALRAAVVRTGPAAVFVWSQVPATGSPGRLAALPDQRPSVEVVVGGPGWQEPLPAGVSRAHSLADAVDRLVAATGG